MLKSRTSHEVRGLKFYILSKIGLKDVSHLTRGAWIEIRQEHNVIGTGHVAPHTRCVD